MQECKNEANNNCKITESNKYIFGAYANLSRDNFIYVINYFNSLHNQISGEKNCPMTDQLTEKSARSFFNTIFSCKSQINVFVKLIEEHFPWIKSIDQKYRIAEKTKLDLIEVYGDILYYMYMQIKEIRNSYSHFFIKEIKCVKIIFSGPEKREEISFFDILNCIYDASFDLVKKRFNASDADLLHLNKYSEKKSKKRSDFKYRLSENNVLTDKGIALLIALFLNRHYGFLFLKQLQGFKRGDTLKYRLTLEVFNALSTKMPILKLRNDFNDNLNLSFDILNELSKMPKELKDKLDPEYLKKFFDLSNDLEDESVLYKIRHQDRFEYFALKFLSTCEEFKNIGFYTYLGNYFHKGYRKKLVDNTDRNRYINYKMSGFCQSIDRDLTDEIEASLKVKMVKLMSANEDENLKIEKIKQLNSVDNFEPYFMEANPHFIVNNNNIGIKILNEGQNVYPTIAQGKVRVPIADYWLSKYELQSMLFYVLLKKKVKNSSSYPLVIDILKNQGQKDIKKNRKEDNLTLIIRRLDKALFWTDSKLKELDNQDNKYLQSGRIADVLIKDIIWLQPSYYEGKDKLTAPNYQALQRALANYNTRKHELYTMFCNAGIIQSKNEHPFLKEVISARYASSDIMLFYASYLKKRKAYFNGVKEKILKNNFNVNCYPLRDLLQRKDSDIKSLTPTCLPRGIFKKYICDILKKSKLNHTVNNTNNNVSYLIKKYCNPDETEQIQSFYLEKRYYDFLYRVQQKKEDKYLSLAHRKKILNKIKPIKIDVIRANDTLEKEDRLKRKNYNKVVDTESYIRNQITRDYLLLLVAKDLLKNYMIEDISLSTIDKVLDREVVNFKIKVNDVSIFVDKIKIKNFSNIYALKYDAKFIFLLKTLNPKVLNFTDWYLECKEFENARIEVIKSSLFLEVCIVKECNNVITMRPEGYYNFSDILSKVQNIKSDIEVEFLKLTRNMFCHNRYINECIKTVNTPPIGSIAKEISLKYKEQVDTFREYVNSQKL